MLNDLLSSYSRHLQAAAIFLRPGILWQLLLGFAAGYLITPGDPLPGAPLIGALALGAWCLYAAALSYLSLFEANQRLLRDDPDRALLPAVLSRPVLIILALASGVAAVTLAAAFGWLSLALMAAGLAFTYCYIMPPVALSESAASLWLLPLCYAGLSTMLGALAAGGLPGPGLLVLFVIIYLLLLARVALGYLLGAAAPLALTCQLAVMIGGVVWLYPHAPERAAAFALVALLAAAVVLRLGRAEGASVGRVWLPAYHRLMLGQMIVLLLDALFFGRAFSLPVQYGVLAGITIATFIWSTWPSAEPTVYIAQR
jgi:hypothetical protein